MSNQTEGEEEAPNCDSVGPVRADREGGHLRRREDSQAQGEREKITFLNSIMGKLDISEVQKPSPALEGTQAPVLRGGRFGEPGQASRAGPGRGRSLRPKL